MHPFNVVKHCFSQVKIQLTSFSILAIVTNFQTYEEEYQD